MFPHYSTVYSIPTSPSPSPGFLSIERDNFIQCLLCSRKFYGNQRRNHYKIHHRTVHLKLREYECNVCRKLFSRIDSLKRHSRVCPTNR